MSTMMMTTTMSLLERLKSRFPGREHQIKQLLHYLDYDSAAGGGDDEGQQRRPQHVASSLYIYGHSSTGKTSLVKEVLGELRLQTGGNLRWAFINCIEYHSHHSQRWLFRRILGQWFDDDPKDVHCDSLVDFIHYIREQSVPEQRLSFILVLDKAERLRDMPETFLCSLLNLSVFTQMNIMTLLISTIVWEKLVPRSGCSEPIFMHFNEYTKADTMKILMRECPPDEDPAFYLNFVELIYAIFHNPCNDVNELRYISSLMFPKYREPILRNELSRSDTVKLFRHIDPYLRKMSDKLYLREMSSFQWETFLKNEHGDDDSSHSSLISSNEELSMELPYFTKYILIASYLASYNPSKLDLRYFSRTSSALISKKSKKTAVKSSSKALSKIRQQLLGPNPFLLDRMLAILHSILDETTLEHTNQIPMQIASLVTLRLLLRVSSSDSLDLMRFKCNVHYDFIRKISRTVQFDLVRYLYDYTS